MADLSITAIDVVAPGTLKTSTAATEAFAIGDLMYFDGTGYAKADGTDSAKLSVAGISLTGGASGEYPILAQSGSRLSFTGATLTKGAMYYLSGSGTAGKIAPFADLGVGDSCVPVFIAESTTDVQMQVLIPTSAITL